MDTQAVWWNRACRPAMCGGYRQGAFPGIDFDAGRQTVPTIDDLLLPTFLEQHGLITLDDVRKAGGGSNTVRDRLQIGRWERAEHRVYRLVGHPTTWRTRLLAPVLSAGNGARASHRSAARLYEIPGFGKSTPEMTVPRGVEFRRKEVRIHTSTDLDRSTRRTVNGIPVTDPARTLLDLARTVKEPALLRAVEYARRSSLTDWSALAKTLARHARPGRPGIRRLRRVILDNASREEVTDSDLEMLFLSIIREAGLPDPVLHYRVMDNGRFVAEVDFAYPGLRIAMELDGTVHLQTDVRERDLARQNDLVLCGWTVLRFTWARLKKSPHLVVEEIRSAMQAAQRAA